ncbi:cytochrome P450 [Massariosphaeria phaeospora]|uniref:Cytochrome P450 n=1 Tax=Massariosphaeria phaeospora TaxID=100035 RepID=A0A7C8IFZ3_9PLEO|nr:cytochrome P450 [Massariosphaeria phaeospora]
MLSLLAPRAEALILFLFGSSILGFSGLLPHVKKYGLLWYLLYPYRAVKDHISAYRFLIDAPGIIQEGYDAAEGGYFVINDPDINYHVVADKKLMREIDHAPKDVLSLQAAAKAMLQPMYSMHRFDWPDVRGFDGTPLIRTVRSLLRNDLGFILPKTRVTNSAIIDDLFSKPGKQPHVTTVVRACISHINALAFFGEEFASNKEFMTAVEDFAFKTILISEAVRLLPGVIGRAVGRLMEAQFSAQHVIFNALLPVAQQRIDEQKLARSGHTVPEHRDVLQWVMEQSSRLRPWTADVTTPWTAERVVHELMALLFGAVHSMGMATTFAIRDICMHPEYVEPLRKEIEGPAYQAWEATGDGLPFLDSFLKESARINPLDNLSTRRKALRPFTLSNGVHVEVGDWLATPLMPMLRDAKHWADPLEFHGFRHVDPKTLASLENPDAFIHAQAASMHQPG